MSETPEDFWKGVTMHGHGFDPPFVDADEYGTPPDLEDNPELAFAAGKLFDPCVRDCQGVCVCKEQWEHSQ